MQALKLPSSAGFKWIKLSFNTFTKRPSPIILCSFIITMLSSMTMILGGLGFIIMVSTTLLFAAIALKVWNNIENNKDHKVGPFPSANALDVLHDKTKLIPLIATGLIYGALLYIINLIFEGLINTNDLQELQSALNQNEDDNVHLMPTLSQSFLLKMLILFIFNVFLYGLFWFVPALSLWHQLDLKRLIIYSIIAFFRNIKPLLVMGLSLFLMAFIDIGIIVSLVMFIGLSPTIASFFITLIYVFIISIMYGCMLYSYKDIVKE